MVLFTTLLFVLAIMVALTVLIIGLGGTSFAIVFGDLIVCIWIIVAIIKKIIKKK